MRYSTVTHVLEADITIVVIEIFLGHASLHGNADLYGIISELGGQAPENQYYSIFLSIHSSPSI